MPESLMNVYKGTGPLFKEDMMGLIDWNDSFSIGLSEIDRQHQVLIGIINDIHEAMLKGKGKSIIGEILQKMNEYTLTHFRHEESMFEKYGYGESAPHMNEHKKFIDKMNEFKIKYEKDEIFLSVELMNFLKEWWTSHINTIDRKYSPFFKSKGMT
jgi:hemerythrin